MGQNFLIHPQVQPEGTVNTWSHRDEGGKKFGFCRDGDVIGNTNVNPNSLEMRDKLGRLWKVEVTGKQALSRHRDFLAEIHVLYWVEQLHAFDHRALERLAP